jgi:hypothetical protein
LGTAEWDGAAQRPEQRRMGAGERDGAAQRPKQSRVAPT